MQLLKNWENYHFNAEYLKEFLNYYNIMSAERDITADKEDDEDKLKSRGYLILTSPDISISPIKSFSNGNCEFLIAQLPVNQHSIHFSTSGNFSVWKFKEAMAEINKHAGRDQNVIL